MKKIIQLATIVAIAFSSCNIQEQNDDVVKQPDKAGSIETIVSTTVLTLSWFRTVECLKKPVANTVAKDLFIRNSVSCQSLKNHSRITAMRLSVAGLSVSNRQASASGNQII